MGQWAIKGYLIAKIVLLATTTTVAISRRRRSKLEMEERE
jgi:hypothetical protein